MSAASHARVRSANESEPARLADVAEDRDLASRLDRRSILAVLAEMHTVESALVDRLFALDAEDAGDDEIWTLEETAQYLRIGVDWLRRRSLGPHALPFIIHVGGAVRVSKKRLFTWLARRTGSL